MSPLNLIRFRLQYSFPFFRIEARSPFRRATSLNLSANDNLPSDCIL
jgi:hypothetical protein